QAGQGEHIQKLGIRDPLMHDHRLLVYGRYDALPAAYGQEGQGGKNAYELNQYFGHASGLEVGKFSGRNYRGSLGRWRRRILSQATATEQGAATAMTPTRLSLKTNMATK